MTNRLESRGVSQANWRNTKITKERDMPYRRTYGKKPAYRAAAKKSYKRKASTNYGTMALDAIKGYALKKLKQKLGLNTESKYIDSTMSGLGTTATLAVGLDPIDGLAQGNTTLTRNGDSVRLTHLRIKGHVTVNALDTGTRQVRIIVGYQPKCPAATQLGASAILTTVTNINSPYASNLVGWQAIYDEIILVNPLGADDSTKRWHFEWHPENCHVRWTVADTTGTFANTEEGAIRVFIMADGASNFPNVTAYCRAYFVDN